MNKKNKPVEDKAITTKRTTEEIIKSLEGCRTGFDAEYVLRQADKELRGVDEPKEASSESSAYKALTLFEFERGILLASSIPERYRIFAVDFSKKLQNEYGCNSPSEKATAELATLNYVRTLEIQNRINNYLTLGTITDTGVKFLQVLSQELDRANRHYLTCVVTLKSLKQPALEVNIKTQTAVIGQNQIVQSNNP